MHIAILLYGLSILRDKFACQKVSQWFYLSFLIVAMKKNNKPSSLRIRLIKRLVTPCAIMSLLIAWWIGFSQQAGLTHVLAEHFNVTTLSQVDGQEHHFALLKQEATHNVYASSANGYGGPLVMVFEIDDHQRIRNATLVDHIDTAGYVVNVMNQRFLDRLNGKSITDALVVGEDIDGVSGATLTVVGMAESVRQSAHEAAQTRGLNIEIVPTSLRFEWTDALLTILVLMVLFERKMPPMMRKYHIMVVGILSVVVIGFWANMALSTAAISLDPRLLARSIAKSVVVYFIGNRGCRYCLAG